MKVIKFLILTLALISLSNLTFGQSTPSVQTNYARRIFGTSAILDGYVDPNNDSTISYFIYWKSSSTKIDTSGIYHNYLDAGAISQTITGLTSNTLYSFKIVAKNKNGTSSGLVNTFFTPTMTAPSVYTWNPGWVGDTDQLQIGGAFQANGLITTTWYQYDSLPTAFRDSTSAVLQQETDQWGMWENLMNLKTYKKYYGRLVAKNDSGITYGNTIVMRTQGSKPPIVATDSATNILQTSAYLNGKVNALGNCYNWRFEYGTSPTSLSNVIPLNYNNTNWVCNSYYSGNPDEDFVSTVIYDLTNNTTYYYRIVGESWRGTTRGNVISFTTQGSLAPDAITLTADSVSYTSAQLIGYYDARGTTPVQNSFEYGKTVYFGLTTVPVSNSKATDSVRVKVPNLESGTVYFFRLKSRNQHGTTYGNVITFTTKNDQPPSVTTDSATAGLTTANAYGSYKPNGTATETWTEWDSVPNLYRFRTSKSSRGTTNGNIAETISGLLTNHIYYVRCADSNAFGKAYGQTIPVRTLNNEKPSTTTDSATGIADTYAYLNAIVDGKGTNSNYMFEYGFTPTSLIKTTTLTSFGMGFVFVSSPIFGLPANTIVYYRIKANNTWGTNFGSIKSFTTSPNQAPAVNIFDKDSLSPTTVQLKIAIDGKGTLSKVAVKYGTSLSFGTQTIFVNATKVVDTIVIKLVNLIPDLLHYTAPIGENSFGTTQGSVFGFTTPNNEPPSVATDSLNTIGLTSVVVYGNFDSKKTSTMTSIEYDTIPNSFSMSTSKISRGTSSGNISQMISGLLINHVYYFRYTADNVYGKAYGQTLTAKTLNNEKPTTSTDSADGITDTYARINANVDGKGTESNYQFEYGLSPTSLINTTTLTSFGKGINSVSTVIYGLAPNATIYYRSKVINVWGFNKGNILSFKTAPAQSPIVSILSIDSVTTTSARITIIIDGQGTIGKALLKYGTSLSLGLQTGFIFASKVVDTIVYRLNLLNPDQQYYFAGLGQNNFGTTQSITDGFVTLNNKPAKVYFSSVSVLPTSVTFYGSYNSKKNNTKVWIQYGINASLNLKTSMISNLTDSNGFSLSASSLLANTWYLYRYYASNLYGADSTALDSFLTPGNQKPLVTTENFSGIGTSYAILNLTVDGRGTNTSTYFIYGTSPSNLSYSTFSTATGKNANTASLPAYGLNFNTVYYYSAVAVNQWGVDTGAIRSFRTTDNTTGNPPRTVPATIDVLTTSTGSTYGTVNATFNGHGNSFSYWVEYNDQFTWASTSIMTSKDTGIQTIPILIPNLLMNRVWYCTVHLKNSLTDTVAFVELSTFNIMPPIAKTLDILGIMNDRAIFHGYYDGFDAGATTWFEYGDSFPLSNQTNKIFHNGTHDSLSLLVNNLKPGKKYFYRFAAKNSYGTNYGDPVQFKTSGIASGIKNDVAKGKISVYPNPTTGVVKVTGYEGVVVLIDLTGKELFRKTVNQSNNVLDLSGLGAGMYMLYSENHSLMQKIIIN